MSEVEIVILWIFFMRIAGWMGSRDADKIKLWSYEKEDKHKS